MLNINNSKIADIALYIAENPKKVVLGAGIVLGIGLFGKCSYNAGEDHRSNQIMEAQNAHVMSHPYKGFDSFQSIVSQHAKLNFMKMKEGQSFPYQQEKITLIERKEDDQLGTVGLFCIGKDLAIIPIGSLPDKMSRQPDDL